MQTLVIKATVTDYRHKEIPVVSSDIKKLVEQIFRIEDTVPILNVSFTSQLRGEVTPPVPLGTYFMEEIDSENFQGDLIKFATGISRHA